MDKLNIDKPQRYYDPKTGDPLQLYFDRHELEIDGIYLYLNGVPLLKNENTREILYPNPTKHIIWNIVAKAKKDQQTHMSIFHRAGKEKRYKFSEKMEFLYSHLDYEFIPGLMRPSNDGFLTPVFFNLSLLNKYSKHPDYKLDLFAETYGTIKGKEWSIEFGINRNKRVIVWLGDISRLPVAEQHYFRSENIESNHDIHSEFYDAQIDVQWAEPSKLSILLRRRSEINKVFDSRYGFELFHLAEEVSTIIENLHRPIFWDDEHVGPTIESLNKILVECIDNKSLKSDIKLQCGNVDVRRKSSLATLQTWIENRTKILNAAELMCSLFVLYDFRKVACHIMSEESKIKLLKSINSRLSLSESNTDYECIYDQLVLNIIASINVMIINLEGGRDL